MALIRTLRTNFNLNPLSLRYVATSSVVWPTATSTAEDKTRVALTLLKSESNPERILDICRSASFNPGSRLDRIALTVAVSKLSEANHAHAISQFIEELKSRPDLNSNESVICHSIVLYGRANMTEHAVQTFKEMDKQGLPQSVNAFNALLFAFILAKDYKLKEN